MIQVRHFPKSTFPTAILFAHMMLNSYILYHPMFILDGFVHSTWICAWIMAVQDSAGLSLSCSSSRLAIFTPTETLYRRLKKEPPVQGSTRINHQFQSISSTTFFLVVVRLPSHCTWLSATQTNTTLKSGPPYTRTPSSALSPRLPPFLPVNDFTPQSLHMGQQRLGVAATATVLGARSRSYFRGSRWRHPWCISKFTWRSMWTVCSISKAFSAAYGRGRPLRQLLWGCCHGPGMITTLRISGQMILLNDRSDRSKLLRSIIDWKANLRSIICRFFIIVKWMGLLLWKQYIIITVRLGIRDNSHLL